jgi:acetyl esterase/lipase
MKKIILIVLTFVSQITNAQEMEIQLYNGNASGSENWTWTEGVNDNNSVKVMTVYNVAHPTLTVVLPEPSIANGTAVIVCPGGGFHFLAINHEGNDVASALVKKGITVFILKYRLVHISGDNPFDDMLNTKDHKAWDDEAVPIIPLAIADGRAAISYVRKHATEYKVQPDRVGIMGFSAGGMVAALTAFGYDNFNRPDFVVPVYGDIPDSRLGKVLPDAPPLYIACAQDDEFGFAPHAINMYNKWYASKRPAEIHLFSKGGHGFGVGNPNNTTHQWLDHFVEWLMMMELLKFK